MSTPVNAPWKPAWYKLDHPLIVDRRGSFAFPLPGPGAAAEHELVFSTWGECEY